MRTRRQSITGSSVEFPVVPRNADGGLERRTYRYARLMQVSIANTYYAWPHRCPDFTVSPTAVSAVLMRNLGLMLLAEPAGFSVVYDANGSQNLLRYLPTQPSPFQVGLSFELQLRTANFENFTRLPRSMNPSSENFYFSNQHAHDSGGRILLNRGRFVRGDELVEVVPGQIPMVVDDSVDRVEVVNIFDDVVLCVPRCVPADVAASMPPDAITCTDVDGQSPPADLLVCRNTIYLDFASLPEGKYTIREVRFFGLPPVGKTVLYTRAFQYAFIDLLFSEPPAIEPGGRGIYPVRGLLGDQPSIVPVHYEVAFRRRATYWRYYVVLPPRSRRARGLTIQSEPPDVATFTGPTPVLIPTATPAFLFVSERRLPLSQRPPARFILNSEDGVLMQSMPIASIDQVLPGFCCFDYSDIYVHV